MKRTQRAKAKPPTKAKPRRMAVKPQQPTVRPETPAELKAEVDEAFEAITGRARPAREAAEPEPEPAESGNKKVDSASPVVVNSDQSPILAATDGPAKPGRGDNMTLTLKGLSKNGKVAFYAGAAQVIRIAVGTFPDKAPPDSFEVADGVFAGPKQPKPKLTAEERKAIRDAKPKPTKAERAAQLRERLARLEAEAAAEQASL